MGLIIFLIMVFVVTMIITLLIWHSHIDITKYENKKCGWASFKSFKKNFDAAKWEDVEDEDDCLCEYNGKLLVSCIADLSFKFNNIGMLMRTPISFIRAKLYANKYIKLQLKKNILYKWD